MKSTLRALALGFVFASLSATPVFAGTVPTTKPIAQSAAAPPRCSYNNVMTARTSYAAYATTLLDTIYTLPKTYRPRDLVGTGLGGGGLVRRVAIADLRAMDAAARRAGARFGVQSAYRSYATQVSTFAYWVRVGGLASALASSARAGHSEHQLGTAIDFKTYGGGSPFRGDWARTKTGAWMAANAWKYGWVNSYPRGQTAATCYEYEPWHYRYVGRSEAARIHASGLAPRAWIWATFGS